MKPVLRRSRFGFTLVEIAVTLAIVGILAAIAAPSLLGFLQAGQQTNRTAIARTVYLAAQNQLTELRITKGLKDALPEYYLSDGSGGYTERDNTYLETYNNVFYELGNPADWPDAGNEPYIHYVSKPKGDTSSFVYKLLDPIILDKSILDGAILIEFNIRTGVVLSVFYSDTVTSLTYSGTGNDSVLGARPYADAEIRNQGYYGVGETGKVETPLTSMISIWDSSAKKLPDSTNVNVLYAEIFIPETELSSGLTLSINGTNVETASTIYDSFDAVLTRTPMVYRNDGSGLETGMARIIWVLDYVGGDTIANGNSYSITRYKDYVTLDASADITVGVQSANVSVQSLIGANPYFPATSSPFNIKTARHLYNIRHAANSSFTLDNDLDLTGQVDNFAPIPDFAGTFTVTNGTISNLQINTTDNAGLFANINLGGKVENLTLVNPTVIGSSNVGAVSGENNGTITNPTLENPSVTGSNNVGGIAGANGGTVSGAYVKFTEDKIISGSTNVGGIVGANTGMLQNSTFISALPFEHVSGGSHTGGIAGTNTGDGRIESALFLALAPGNVSGIVPITDTDDPADLYDVMSSFYLSGNPIRPAINAIKDAIPTRVGYNEEPLIGAGTRINTDGDFSTVLSSWTKHVLTSAAVSLNVNNKVYPYPYFADTFKQLAVHPNWPITKLSSDSNLLYYERYTDGTEGLTPVNEVTAGNLADKIVTNDGYAIELPYYSGKYELSFGTDTSITLSASGTESAAAWDIKKGTVTSLTWPVSNAFKNEENDTMYRFYIPNSYIEQYGTSVTLQVKRDIDTSTDKLLIDVPFNPLFAAGSNNIIRSPRHIVNIGKALNGSYTQQLDVDFAAYHMELNDTEKLAFTKSVVPGEFTGNYDGKTLSMKNLTINSTNESAALFAQVRGGIISNITLENVTVTSESGNAGGITVDNTGTISNIRFNTLTVTSISGNAGGIVGTISRNAITDVMGTKLTVSSVSAHAGGIVGTINESTISNIDCTVVNVTSTSGNAGGVAGDINGHENSSSTIENVKISALIVSSNASAGGVASSNNGRVIKASITNAEITGGTNVGGIAGQNRRLIESCEVTNAEIAGNNNVGGIAGTNTSGLTQCGVKYSTVHANNTDVGGIAGTNTGTVADVFFLSVAGVESVPVTTGNTSNPGGGIVGDNTGGSVRNAFYLAPAPSVTASITDDYYTHSLTIYPIVRTGNPSEKTPVTGDGGPFDTCFYLLGTRYSFDNGVKYVENHYNRASISETVKQKLENPNGGISLISKFVDKGFLESIYNADLSAWTQSARDYPYPIVNKGFSAPDKWVLTDSPVRPDQVDRKESEWETSESPNNINSLSFINGEFEMPLMNPNNSANTYNIIIGAINDNVNQPSGWNNPGNPPCISEGKNYYNMYAYYDHNWVQGWNTRPVNSNDYNNLWNAIEFQRPVGSATYSRVRTNYKGTTDGVYAELNADVPGTLWQVCNTVPGNEYYYSFYHAARTNSNNSGTDKMTFYLSGVTYNNGWNYTNGTGRPSVIRPCETKRGTTNGTPATRDTIAYGSKTFFDPKTGGTRTAYLYDVWVGTATSTTGYGVTFWSTSNIAIGTAVGQIPTVGVTDLTTAKTTANQSRLPSTLINDAKNNIIGYWDVPYFGTVGGVTINRISEWKQYYGLIKIPEGQLTTEFAYESNSGSTTEGNYLDGITFQSPGFLSVNKYIRFKGEETNSKYVKPGDMLTVELHVKNHGEATVNTISLKDRLSPYDIYVGYMGNIRTNKTGVTATGGYTNGIVDISLGNLNLAAQEEIIVSFDIQARINLFANGKDLGVSTLQYHFKNQAAITYKDAAFGKGYAGSLSGYTVTTKSNSSGEPVQVFIDPVKLSKTVSGVDMTPVDDDPFNVTLTIDNTQETTLGSISTSGLVTLLIPQGFTLLEKPEGAAVEPDVGDGITRVTVSKVNLSPAKKSIELTYKLKYNGDGYGVTYDSISASYRYVFRSDAQEEVNVMMDFPNTVVGIRVKTSDDVLELDTTKLEKKADGSPGDMSFDIFGNDKYSNMLEAAGYEVKPEVILCDKDGNPVSKNSDENYQITYFDPEDGIKIVYTAKFLKSEKLLVVTPTPLSGDKETDYKYKDDEYTFYYRILLDAVLSGSPSFNLSSPVTKVTVNVGGTDKPETPPATETSIPENPTPTSISPNTASMTSVTSTMSSLTSISPESATQSSIIPPDNIVYVMITGQPVLYGLWRWLRKRGGKRAE